MSARNKLSGFYDKINKCNCPTIIDSAVLKPASQGPG